MSARLFLATRLRLTVLYTGIFAIVLLISSGAVYLSYARNAGQDVQGDFASARAEDAYVQSSLLRLVIVLAAANSAILVLASGASYVLAGATLRPIRDAFEQQQRFLSDSSHELRTPLTVLKTAAEVTLAHPASDEEYRQALRDQLHEIDGMAALVSDLLLLSRLDAQPAPRSLAVFNLANAVATTIERLEPYANSRHVTLSFAPDASDRVLVRGVEDELTRALANVIRNGIEYNRPHGDVSVRLTVSGSTASVATTDTGLGIPSDALPHLFERFRRVDRSRSHATGGSGLGLAIVRAIMQHHHGAVTVRSVAGQGTTVTLTLPTARAS